jgi:hypothetical protein
MTRILLLLSFLVPAAAQAKGASVLMIAGPTEPGTRLVQAGRIFKADGRRPAPGVRVLVYQRGADDPAGAVSFGQRTGTRSFRARRE